MTPEERIARIEKSLDRHIEFVEQSIVRVEQSLDRQIEFVGKSLDRLTERVNRTVAAQEVTEKRLQDLITHVDGSDGHVKRLEDRSN